MTFKKAITPSRNGVQIKVHVLPSSSQSVFPAGYNEWRQSIEIKVKAETRENKANIEIIETIAKYLNISPKNVSITSGQKRRLKTVAIRNEKIDDICTKIKEALDGL